MTTPAPLVCVVVGVGPGNGTALARRFAAEGRAVALLARSTETTKPLAASLPYARAYACDVTDPAAIAETFATIRDELGPVETLLYNAGPGCWGTPEETTIEQMEEAWRINALGLLLASQQVIPTMKEAGRGTILVTGATASRRGGARFTAFASAKAAQRSLAQSMARHLGSKGIHVALLIVDGVVDLPYTREMMEGKPDEFFMQPDDIAQVAWDTCQQSRSAWSFEVEVRPFCEVW